MLAVLYAPLYGRFIGGLFVMSEGQVSWHAGVPFSVHARTSHTVVCT